MTRKNPSTGMHPDLFGGESRVFVPLEDLTEKQIKKLPRDAFSNDEWDLLDEDAVLYIYAHDPVSKKRIALLKNALVNRVSRVISRTKYDFNDLREREDVQEEISSAPSRIEALHPDLYRRQMFLYTSHGFNEDTVLNTMVESLRYGDALDLKLHSENVEDSLFTVWNIQSELYLDPEDIDDHLEEGIRLDEIERALHLATEKLDGAVDFDERTADALFRISEGGYPEVRIDIDTGVDIVGVLNEEGFVESLEDDMDRKDPDFEPTGQAKDARSEDERKVYVWDDDFYALDLTADELEAEGEAQGMCIGDDEHGYARAKQLGLSRFISIRRPRGKPLLTLELSLDEDGDIFAVEQIVGNSNRMPGWGKSPGVGRFKWVEVQRAVDLVRSLGVDPMDVAGLHDSFIYDLARQGKPWPDDAKMTVGFEKKFPTPVDYVEKGLKLMKPRSNPGYTCRHGCSSGFCIPYQG